MSDAPLAIHAAEAAARTKPSSYPEPYRSRMSGRTKRPLGDLFGLQNFGVNLTTMQPGASSALMHRHSKQDEFIYIVSGEITLVTEAEEIRLGVGMCAGFPAGGVAHMLKNTGLTEASYLEVGDRTQGDVVTYPNDDIKAEMTPQGWVFVHKDGSPF